MNKRTKITKANNVTIDNISVTSPIDTSIQTASVISTTGALNDAEKKIMEYHKALLPLRNDATLHTLRQASGFIKVSDIYKQIKPIVDEYGFTVQTVLSDIGISGDKELKAIENRFNSWKSTNYKPDGSLKSADDRKAERQAKKAERETRQADQDKKDGMIRVNGFPLEVAIQVVNMLNDDDLLKLHKVMLPLLDFAKQAMALKELKETERRKVIADKLTENTKAVVNMNTGNKPAFSTTESVKQEKEIRDSKR